MADDLMPENAGISIQVQAPELERLRSRIDNPAKRRQVITTILRKASTKVQEEAIRRVRKRTGNTARTIRSRVSVEDLSYEVGAFSSVGRFLEFGTGIFGPKGQRIFPKHAQALRWPVGDIALSGRARAGGGAQFAYARSIKGMEPRPFLMPAYEASQGYIDELINSEMGKVFESES